MSQELPSVAVLANCIHASLARTLRKSERFSRVESVEVYTVPVDAREETAASLEAYDFILTLEHAEGFGPLSTASLRNRFGDRVFALPTPFFSGTLPDMAYLTLRGQISRAPGVLGDYHSALILAECADGLSEDDVVRRYVDGSAFDRIDVEGVWDDSIGELRRREDAVEIRVSNYILERKAMGLISTDFLSFNHPTEGLINHIIASFLRVTLGIHELDKPLLPAEHNLYQDARWPLHPAVARRLGLPCLGETRFKSPNRLGGEEMTIEEFARRSCRFLRTNTPIGHFAIHTPWYLSKRIRPLHPGKDHPQEHGNMRKAKQVIINHFGRSGSTVLAMMLQQHPSISWLHEFFSHYSIKSLATYNFTRDEMVRMVGEAAEDEWNKNPEAYVGHEIKLMNFLQNPSCEMEEYLAGVADPEKFFHIVLLRKNTLRRILSVYKAMQTKVYHSKDDSYRKSKVMYAVDFSNLFDPDTGQRAATLPALLEKAQAREDLVLDIYRTLGIPHFVLNYEDDIEASPEVAYGKVIRWLGLPEKKAAVTLSKTGGALSEEVSNFSELANALRGTRFEWMLGNADD